MSAHVDVHPVPGISGAPVVDAASAVWSPPARAPALNDSPVVHEYDGIEECDNQLPRWWLNILFGSIVFAIGYWLHYQTFDSGVYPRAMYEQERAAAAAVEAERLKTVGSVTPDQLVALSKDSGTVTQGAAVFKETCAACHGPAGAGLIGPNLTDAYWIHGGAPDAIYKTIRDGFLAKGMPAWGPQLGETRVRAAAAYVLTLKNTNVVGKAAEGDKDP